MTKQAYTLLLFLCIFLSSCALVLKGLARAVVDDYDDYSTINLSPVQLIDSTGKQRSFAQLFPEKTVYLYIWGDKSNKTPDLKDKKYGALVQRFAKYPDVAFARLSVGMDSTVGADSYRLVVDESSAQFRSILKLSEPAPFIIGKDGKLLVYKGPKPNDDLLVDYVLYEARNGVDGTKSARRLIKGVNKNGRFKSNTLRTWYAGHFGQEPDKLSFSFSTTN